MSRLLALVSSSLAVCLFCGMVAALWLIGAVQKPVAPDSATAFIIENGMNGRDVAAALAERDIISNPDIFYGLLRLRGGTLRAGEYDIPPRASMADIQNLFATGAVVQRTVTIPEGSTVKQIIAILNATEFLTGTIDPVPREGALHPDTYAYTRGEDRNAVVKRMLDAHDALLNELWMARDTSLPLRDKNDAVTLASIVEKETGIAAERPRIAGLFYNRLRLGMPLQTDPTIVYAITNGLGHMQGRRLLKKHLDVNSPYNTYKNAGLPPGPIANVGRAALAAVFEPEAHDYLYFVADGTGGHVFAKTLAEHNANVAKWRKIRREREKKTN